MVEIGIPEEGAWGSFEHLAAREGWIVPSWELDLYRRNWPDAAAVLLDDGEPRGFVTAAAFDRHGWIGNLIVDPVCRGRGFGRQLFSHALDSLERRGCTASWLTASAQGRPLYEAFGFRPVDRVERWVLKGNGAVSSNEAAPEAGIAAIAAADAAVWGVDRSGLIAALGRGATVFACGETVALLQPGTETRVLGPWLSPSRCPRENRAVMARILAETEGETTLVADILASSPVRRLFAAAGFVPLSGSDLMARGEKCGACFASLVAFASLGSLG